MTGGDKELRATTKDHRNFFLTRTFPDTFSWSILHKKPKLKKCQIFDQNHANFVGFLNPFFCGSESLLCYIKRRKSFFHDLFSRSMIWEYMGLQGVTGCYKGLQGGTKGDRG